MDNNFNMTFEESQDYIAKRGFDVPWNDCDVFVDEREINRTVGNVLKWADKTMIEKACEWLKKRTYQDCLGVSPIARLKVGFSSVEELVDEFIKAMEE